MALLKALIFKAKELEGSNRLLSPELLHFLTLDVTLQDTRTIQ